MARLVHGEMKRDGEDQVVEGSGCERDDGVESEMEGTERRDREPRGSRRRGHEGALPLFIRRGGGRWMLGTSLMLIFCSYALCLSLPLRPCLSMDHCRQ
jgi:hypothetical protein